MELKNFSKAIDTELPVWYNKIVKKNRDCRNGRKEKRMDKLDKIMVIATIQIAREYGVIEETLHECLIKIPEFVMEMVQEEIITPEELMNGMLYKKEKE